MIIPRVVRLYFICTYYLSWLWFAVGGVALSLVCLPLLLTPWRARFCGAARTAIRCLFSLWIYWFKVCGVVQIRWHGFDRPLLPGTIYVANHPTLVDAVFLLSRLPDAVCILKPQLMSNPAIGSAAKLAGYVSARDGIDLLRDLIDRLNSGCSVLIFPEGTRTGPGEFLGPMKPGYALISERSQSPVQLCLVRATKGMVGRGYPWWKPPPVFPGVFDISLDRCWAPASERGAACLAEEVRQHLTLVLKAKNT